MKPRRVVRMTGRNCAADLAVAEAIRVQQRGCFLVARTVNLDGDARLGSDRATLARPPIAPCLQQSRQTFLRLLVSNHAEET